MKYICSWVILINCSKYKSVWLCVCLCQSRKKTGPNGLIICLWNELTYDQRTDRLLQKSYSITKKILVGEGWARVGAVDQLAEEERFRRRKEGVREEREGHRLSRGMDRVEREWKGRGEDYWKGGRFLKGGSEQSEGLHFFYRLLHALNRILVLEWFSLIYKRLFNCYYQQTTPLVIGFFILPFNGRGILTIRFMDKL